jgi:hypothetical protein
MPEEKISFKELFKGVTATVFLVLLIIYAWAVFNVGGVGGSSPNPTFDAFLKPTWYIIIAVITLIVSPILTFLLKWTLEIIEKVKSNKK